MKERGFWIITLLVTIATSIFIIINYQTTIASADQKIIDLVYEKALWNQKETNLLSEITDLKAQAEKDHEIMMSLPVNDLVILSELKRKGFNDGPSQVIDDLKKHNELIPFDGVLGGTMRISKVFLISDKWVVAFFDDGHIIGNMLLSYRLENDRISWKVIDAYIFGQ